MAAAPVNATRQPSLESPGALDPVPPGGRRGREAVEAELRHLVIPSQELFRPGDGPETLQIIADRRVAKRPAVGARLRAALRGFRGHLDAFRRR